MRLVDFLNTNGYDWGDIWYADMDMSIGSRALRSLIKNQEESFLALQRNFDEQIAKNEILNSISNEQERDYYYSQFLICSIFR